MKGNYRPFAQKYGQAHILYPGICCIPGTSGNFIFPIDGHWKAAGHALAARYLSEQIGNRLQKH